MNNAQDNDRLARPADEEIKKHGDQLRQQVRDAAGAGPDTDENSPSDVASASRPAEKEASRH